MKFWLTCVVAGLSGAVAINLYLIVVEAFVLKSATVLTISQWDASNIIGLSAFGGGVRTAWIGFGMHVVVSTLWATSLAALSTRFPSVVTHWAISGVAFGLVVMIVMLDVVVPFGHAPNGHASAGVWLDRTVAHTLFFGIPVAWIVSKFRQ